MRARNTVAGVMAVTAFMASCGGSQTSRNEPRVDRPGTGGPYPVVDVVDGDTLKVNAPDRITIRVIGIDTPETVDPRRPVECFGREASARAHELLDGEEVSLESDPTQGDRDHFGRTLAYVWLADGRSFGETLIREGYAFEYTHDTPYEYQAEYDAAEAAARDAERGLWAPDACA
jgi:micrococcal nuclease